MKKPQPTPGFESLLEKARTFCAYRERSTAEVRKKIRGWGVSYALEEKLIKALHEDGFVNDARFAASLVRGKFRTNKWGKRKIKAALQAAGIPDNIIREALTEIDPDKYADTARELVEKKNKSFTEELDSYSRKAKLFQYLLQKGFETDVISRVIAILGPE